MCLCGLKEAISRADFDLEHDSKVLSSVMVYVCASDASDKTRLWLGEFVPLGDCCGLNRSPLLSWILTDTMQSTDRDHDWLEGSNRMAFFSD